MWRKRTTCTLLVGIQIDVATLKNSMEFPPTKIKLPYDLIIPLLGMYIKKIMKTLIRKDTFTPAFIEALFTVVKIWEQVKCPSRDEWIKRSQHAYTIEYYQPPKG